MVGVAKIGCESMRIVQSKVEHRLILRLHNREDLYVLPSPHPQPASLTAPSERRPEIDGLHFSANSMTLSLIQLSRERDGLHAIQSGSFSGGFVGSLRSRERNVIKLANLSSDCRTYLAQQAPPLGELAAEWLTERVVGSTSQTSFCVVFLRNSDLIDRLQYPNYPLRHASRATSPRGRGLT